MIHTVTSQLIQDLEDFYSVDRRPEVRAAVDALEREALIGDALYSVLREILLLHSETIGTRPELLLNAYSVMSAYELSRTYVAPHK